MKYIKNIKQYIEYYDESELSAIIGSIGKKIGKQVVMSILVIAALLSDTKIPMKTRMVFMAALGYLILPTDLVADFLPVIGFTDDIAFLTYVVSNAREYITPEIKDKARNQMGKWINEDTEEADIIENDFE